MSPYQLVIKTTAACQARCRACSMRHWMNAYKGYHLSLEDLTEFIRRTKRSGYHFTKIRLAGGEPLLWKHLIEGSRMLREGDICDSLQMVTNGLRFPKMGRSEVADLIESLDWVEISDLRAEDSGPGISFMKKHFPEKLKRINKSTNHVVVPARFMESPAPFEDALPAACNCSSFSLMGNHVDICSRARPVVLEMGFSISDYPYISERVRDNYLSRFLSMDRFRQPLCRLCIGNRKVSSRCLKESEWGGDDL